MRLGLGSFCDGPRGACCEIRQSADVICPCHACPLAGLAMEDIICLTRGARCTAALARTANLSRKPSGHEKISAAPATAYVPWLSSSFCCSGSAVCAACFLNKRCCIAVSSYSSSCSLPFPPLLFLLVSPFFTLNFLSLHIYPQRLLLPSSASLHLFLFIFVGVHSISQGTALCQLAKLF